MQGYCGGIHAEHINSALLGDKIEIDSALKIMTKAPVKQIIPN